MRKQKGMAAIMITVTILAVLTIITLFTARVIITDNKIYNNVNNSADALNAAQAGINYAVGYLNAYPYVVIGGVAPNGLGYCASAATTYVLPSPGALANGATYTMTFSCITAGDFNTFNLTVVGTTQDGSATGTIKVTLKQYCGVSIPLTSRGAVNVNGTAIVTNLVANATRTLDTGATFVNANMTTTAAVNSATGGAYSCVRPIAQPTNCRNVRSLIFATPATTALTVAGGMNNQNYQQLYLGRQVATTTVAGMLPFSSTTVTPVYNFNCTAAANVFTPTTTFASRGCTAVGSAPTSTVLNGISNAIIYINIANRALTLNAGLVGLGGFTLGAAGPVILVVNATTGNLVINANSSGSMTINGNVYYSSTTGNATINSSGSGASTVNGLFFSTDVGNISGGAVVNGAVVSNVTTLAAASRIIYTPGNISNTLNGYCGGAYAVVPGSWRDF